LRFIFIHYFIKKNMNPSLLLIPDRYKAAKLYSQIPDSGAGDLTFARASVATRVNASGLIESVASGVPRLDYTGGGCPSLLLEPQRANLLNHSNKFDEVVWQKDSCTVLGGFPDPAGGNDAWQVTYTATGALFRFLFGTGGNISRTIFAKQGTLNQLTLQDAFSGAGQTKTLTSEWQRFQFSNTEVGNSGYQIAASSGTIFIYGAQFEAGSYPTSYIPTLGSSVTRLADVASKTGISSLIGTTEGVLFFDFKMRADSGINVSAIRLTGGSDELVVFGESAGNLGLFSTKTGLTYIQFSTAFDVRYKLAYAWKANDYALYVNGAPISLTSVASGFTSLANVYVNQTAVGAEIGKVVANTAAFYTTRLSNSELATLTSL
jgi:hypothetical protein